MAKRNEILIKTARDIVKKYGPDFDRGLPPIVNDAYQELAVDHYRSYQKTTDPVEKNISKWSVKAHGGAKWYTVQFPIDLTKESFNEFTDYAAMIWIWADNGKAFTATFTRAGALYNLDENPKQKAKFEYRPRKPYKTFIRDTVYYDKDGKEVRKRTVQTINDY